MIKPQLVKPLNDQMVNEIASAYIYFGLAPIMEKAKMPGAANWMIKQAYEELEHAAKFYRYLIDQDANVELAAVSKPALSKVKTPLEAFHAALAQEKHVTQCIDVLKELALKSKDYATSSFLEYFTKEQVEEEVAVRDIIDKFEIAAKEAGGYLFIDAELGKR